MSLSSLKMVFTLTVLSALTASAALAAGPHPSIETLVRDGARESGRAEDDVRRDAIERLREEGRFSEADLERISRGDESGVDKTVRDLMIERLERAEEPLPARTDLTALADAGITASAGKAFAEMAPREIELPSALKSGWVDQLIPGAPVHQNDRVTAEFSIVVSSSPVAPYADSYGMTVRVNGRSFEIKDNALVASTAVELLKHVRRTNPGLVLRGHMTAVRVARDFPPYGYSRFLDLTLE